MATKRPKIGAGTGILGSYGRKTPRDRGGVYVNRSAPGRWRDIGPASDVTVRIDPSIKRTCE